MEVSLKSLSRIDDRAKYAVSGWLRKEDNSMNLYHIPLISCLCVLFFGGSEIFEIPGNDVKISEDGKSITKIGNEWNDNRNTSYGMKRIWSKSDVIYQWNLMIKAYITGMYIGLSSVICPDKYYPRQVGQHYVYWNEGMLRRVNGEWDYKYGTHAKVCDIVSIRLDLKNREIRILVNGEDQGIAYQGDDITIDDDIEYRLAIIMCDPGDCVEIVDFVGKA